MVSVIPLQIEGRIVIGIEVLLPKTTLLAITAGEGYIMCGADNVSNLSVKPRSVIIEGNPLWDKHSE
jgi:uncharacterized protein YunC (DUF1805 family)